MKTTKDLREMKTKDLQKMLDQNKIQLAKLKAQSAIGETIDHNQGTPKNIRKEIARILTILKERAE